MQCLKEIEEAASYNEMDLSVLQTTGDSNVEAFLWPLLDELDAQLAMIKEQGIMKCEIWFTFFFGTVVILMNTLMDS